MGMYKATAQEYKALREAILSSCENGKNEDYKQRLYKLVYTFIKSYTGASAYIVNGDAIAEVDGLVTVIKLPGNKSLKSATKSIIDLIEDEKDMNRIYKLAQYIYLGK